MVALADLAEERARLDRELGRVWGGSGVRNLCLEGYWFHKPIKLGHPRGFSFKGLEEVAKTTTLLPNAGRMPLNKRNQPKEWSPNCIWVDRKRSIALNAIGLSGPGAKVVFEKLQKLRHRFQPSIMAIGTTLEERLAEMRLLMKLIVEHFSYEQVPIVQINVSCPNLEHGFDPINERIVETQNILDIVYEYGRFAVIKLSADFLPERVMEFAEHPALFGISGTNTIPFRMIIPWLPEDHECQIPWDELFGVGQPSPLRARGIDADGGLSGAPLKNLACLWIGRIRK
ncbi:MAG: hypothetical protein WEC58_02915, partial [Candidatus Paceibacterota bacterium]